MKLIPFRDETNRRFFRDAVLEFRAAILSDQRIAPVSLPVKSYLRERSYAIWRASEVLNRWFGVPRFACQLGWFGADDYFAIIMGWQDIKHSFPYVLSAGVRGCYFFDLWPAIYDNVIDFVVSTQLDFLFVSSRTAAQRMAKRLSHCIVEWIPEGFDPSVYRHAAYDQRTIDLVQFGRKHELYHSAIVSGVRHMGTSYLYCKGTPLFPSREAFVKGLANTKISICFPKSMTHPELAGDIETMTLRYLQSMGSKCLVVGHAPAEMIELFGYNPVIEVDWIEPRAQILDILHHYEEFVPLIERNYNIVTTQHSWHNRWRDIASFLLR